MKAHQTETSPNVPNGPPDGMPANVKWRLITACALFLVSLLLPGLELADGNSVEGWRILLVGWYGFIALEFPWIANLFFMAGIIAGWSGYHRRAGILGCAAALAGLLSLRSNIWIANHVPIDHLGSGFYVWMIGFITLATLMVGTRKAPI